MGIEQ